MNVPNFPEGKRPKATDVSPWYGVYSREDAKHAKYKKIKNSKLEIRNSKQIQMIKKQKIPNNFVLNFDFWI